MTHQQYSLLAAAAILLISAVFIWNAGSNVDEFLFLNKQASLLPDALWSNLTLTADTVYVMALLLLAASLRPALIAPALLLLLTGTIIVHASKAFFDAARPAAVLAIDSFHIIGPTLRHHSFPSGHSFTIFASLALISQALRAQWTLPLLLLALAGAFSRIAVGAHWPLDVLVGSALGLLTAVGCVQLAKRLNWPNHPVSLLISMLLMTLAAIWLPFFDSRYPFTLPLSTVTAIAALVISWCHFWSPVQKLTRSLTQGKSS